MIKRFFSQAWLTFKASRSGFNFEVFLVYQLLAPLFGLLSACMIAGYSFNTDNLTWWVVGSSFIACSSGIIFTLGGTFNEERFMGTLKSIIVSPGKKLWVILQKGFFPVFISVALLVFELAAGGLIFGVSFAGLNFGLLIAVMLVSIVAAIGFTIFLSIFALMTDSMHFILNTVAVMMGVLCGASFPITQLPGAIQVFSYLLPLTRSIQAANMLFSGFDGEVFLRLILWEAGIAVIYFVLGAVLIKFIEKISVKKASFDAF